MKKIDAKNYLNEKQLDLARTIAARHGLSIPERAFADYEFGKRFLDLFAYDPENNELTGFKRVAVLESYFYYNKDPGHLHQKLEISHEDVLFMRGVLAKYKYGGELPLEDLQDPDPEGTAYKKLEEELEQKFG